MGRIAETAFTGYLENGIGDRKLRGLAKDGPIFVALNEMPKDDEVPKFAVILAVTEVNGCRYCAWIHGSWQDFLGENSLVDADEALLTYARACAEAGYPPTRHLDAFEYMRESNARFTIHAGEAFGLPSIHEAIAFCGRARGKRG